MDPSRHPSHQLADFQHATSRSRSNSSQAMAHSAHESHFDSIPPHLRSGPMRGFADHNYHTVYPEHGYHNQPFSTQPLQPISHIQGVESYYPSSMQDTGRQHQLNRSRNSNAYRTHFIHSMLADAQQSTMFEPMSGMHDRSLGIPSSIANHYSIPSCVASDEPIVVCTENNLPQYATTSLTHSSYRPTPTPISKQNPSYTAPTESHTSPGQSEAQAQQEVVLDEEDTGSSFQTYEQQLRATFEAIVKGRINEASNQLLTVSRWFLSSVVRLGLHFDNENEYQSRLAMWREFNHCWEALAQKQKNIMLEETYTKRKAADKLTSQTIIAMVDELVSLCDRLEEFGLVDYEMGVWEEQIVGGFICCLDLLNEDGKSRGKARNTGKKVN